MPRKKALFVTFEGIEGVGKSTQIRAVVDHFQSKGRRVFLTREPGGSPLSDGIRGVLLQSSKGLAIDPISELLLVEAARRQHVVDVLRVEMERNDVVLCDRFTDSTVAYQGGGREIDLKKIETLNSWATDGLTPDVTILLDAPVSLAVPRALKRIHSGDREQAEDRFEKEKTAFHERVREAYLRQAKKHPGRFVLIDATGTPQEISKVILAKLEERMKDRS